MMSFSSIWTISLKEKERIFVKLGLKMSENLNTWNLVKQVPQQFLKPISFGKLKGKSDINPQWRLMAMTQAFGQVGHGWTYRIVRTWSEPHPNGSVMCFAEVAVKTKVDGEWGQEFSGVGGSEIIESNKNGLQSNDDGYKMAVTDALGVAFKAVGVASDIYLGNFDGSKYKNDINQAFCEPISQTQYDELKSIIGSLSEQGRAVVINDLNQKQLTLRNLPKSDFLGFKAFLDRVK